MNNAISFEEYLDKNGTLTYTNRGASMEPLLRAGRDLFTVTKKGAARCRVGDVVLFRREDSYVLHRIIQVRDTDYVCLGDNSIKPETGVRDEDILGVMTGFVRRGKTWRTDDPRCRAYTAWILKTRRVRVLGKRAAGKARRILRERKSTAQETASAEAGGAYRAAMEDVIYLARCAVNGEKPDAARIAGMDLRQLYRAADRHMMTAVTAAALEQAGIKDAAFVQAQAKAMRRNAALDAELTRIASALEDAGIWYMPLKGAVIKDWYPRFGMRQMSDYDVLFDDARSDEVRAIMEGMGYTIDDYGRTHQDLYQKPPFYVFEMHRRLFDYNEKLPAFRYYADVKSRLLPDGEGCRLRFAPEDFYVYMLAHEYKHYVGRGSGLRACLDLYVVLRRFGDSLDKSYIAGELQKLGLTEFERVSRELACALFGDGEWTAETKAVLENRLLAGVYGSEENRVSRDVKQLGGGAAGKLRYVLGRLIVSRQTVQEAYPFFWKHKVLLPLLPAYRLARGIAIDGPRVRTELAALLRLRKR